MCKQNITSLSLMVDSSSNYPIVLKGYIMIIQLIFVNLKYTQCKRNTSNMYTQRNKMLIITQPSNEKSD